MRTHFDLAILNAGELLTLSGASLAPKKGASMDELGLISKGAVGISKGKITWVGRHKQFRRAYTARHEIDAGGGVVLPGFIDPHTHAVFAGSREAEWLQKMRGLVPYLDILKKGGGILSTVEHTRAASPKTLFESAKITLNKMLEQGTTTVEIKSGYGLDLKQEQKILNVIQRLKKTLPMDVVPTYLGAHVLPKTAQDDRSAYVREVIDSLPKMKPAAAFCDVFCEDGAFTASEAAEIFTAAKAAGFQVKLHAGQFSDLGGIGLADRFQAVSIDHLDVIRKKDIPVLARSGSIAVLLPGVSHFLNSKKHAPARALIDGGVPVALATDFNPGSSPCLSMQEIIHLAVLKLKMTPAEAISAGTINAAHALGLSGWTGSLELGKQADLIILDVEHYEQLPYYFGVNHVNTVIKNGRVVYSEQGGR